MLDEFARNLIESARLPLPLTGTEARELISRAYLTWLARNVFDSSEADTMEVEPNALNRLSLASSLFQSAPDSTIDPTSLLVAEAADVARMFVADSSDLPASARFRKAIHYLDLASFFHLADFDANAQVVAKEAAEILNISDLTESGIVPAAQLSYYRALAFFLLGQFGNCRGEAAVKVEAESAEERAIIFLKGYLGDLTNKYKSSDYSNSEIERRFAALVNTLSAREHPYSMLAAEVTRLSQFNAAVGRKSLYRLLLPVFTQEQEYLSARVSGDDNHGHPFAWPPAREFYSKYLSVNVHHAVITVPTGGGKSFLAELATARALRDGWVLYLAPTNALCAQIKKDLKSNLMPITDADVEAFFGNLEYTAELPLFRIPKQALVITPEKALLLLKREPERFKQCSLVVLDECHMLGSHDRGDIAEIVLSFCLAQNPEVRVVLMSALVRDGAKLAQWLEHSSGKPAAQVALPWRPTRTARVTVLPDWGTLTELRAHGKRRESVKVRAFADTVTPWEEATRLQHWITPIEIERVGTKDFEWINYVSRKLAELFVGKKIPTLVFVIHSRHYAFSMAVDFEAQLPPRPEITQREQDLYTLASYELGAPSLVESLVNQKGAAVHTASMLNCEREAAEIAFDSGRALSLMATGTLSQGLNLAAKAVVICGTELTAYGDELGMDPKELQRRSLTQVLNAAGRAARANIACRGVSIVVPDRLIRSLTKESSKRAFIQRINALALPDASLTVESPIRHRLELVSQENEDAGVSDYDLVLLATFPADEESLRATLKSTLGASELNNDEVIDRIAKRLERVRSDAINSGYNDWILTAASLAGMRFTLASSLYEFIESRSADPSFAPPDDTYFGWANLLIDWLQTTSADASWDLLRFHIKAWRRSRGKDKDPDLIKILEESGYPGQVSSATLHLLAPIWENMKSSVLAWLDGKTYLEVGETLLRRECALDKRSSRTDAGQHLPRAITWSQRFIEHLARFAGLLLSIQNQWLEHEAISIPNWLGSTVALPTFPLGLRFGVKDPFALAWHRHVISERRAANLLQSLAPLDMAIVDDLPEAWRYVEEAKNRFIEMRFSDDTQLTNLALQRLLT